jgi:hypothetical protein
MKTGFLNIYRALKSSKSILRRDETIREEFILAL